MNHRFLPLSAAIFLGLCHPWLAQSGTSRPVSLAELTSRAAHVFRAHCVAAEGETAKIAGVRLPVTTYTFHVSEHLKGGGTETMRFRQVGSANAGPRDLGRLAGLPVYNLNSEYVLFLLPESRAGLTSPSVAGQGAFIVSGDRVQAVKPQSVRLANNAVAASSTPPSPEEPMSYQTFRRAVLDSIGR